MVISQSILAVVITVVNIIAVPHPWIVFQGQSVKTPFDSPHGPCSIISALQGLKNGVYEAWGDRKSVV